MAFKKAERSQLKMKLAIEGPSGAGKTLSALLIASGFVEPVNGKIAVADSENESSAIYSDLVPFDINVLRPPFTVKQYITAIQEAIDGGYEVLVLDSISHEWAGKGGLLEVKDALDASGKGSGFTNWGAVTKSHNAFIEAIVQAPIHIIVTMRSKQDYVLVEKGGKQVPQKVGLAPIQRDGVEFEFYTVLSLAMNHMASCSKDRTGLFDGRDLWMPSKATGLELRNYVMAGKELLPEKSTEILKSLGVSLGDSTAPATTTPAETKKPEPANETAKLGSDRKALTNLVEIKVAMDKATNLSELNIVMRDIPEASRVQEVMQYYGVRVNDFKSRRA